jgi:mono/diheme cytochrome c family protein
MLLTVGFTLSALLAVSLSAAADEAEQIEKGKQVYTVYCVTCHGPNGDGKGPVGMTLDPPPRDFTKGEFKYGSTDQDIFEVVTNGAAAKGGSALMAPWGAVIPEADRWAVVQFIRSLRTTN